MHDRRIDGETYVFGNAGTLFMSAMTWFDHETRSTWSQPWGRAIDGELKDIELFLIPSQLTSWGSWKVEHPETLIMTNRLGRFGSRGGQRFNEQFVIGLILAGHAKAYYFADVEHLTVVNDHLGSIPILVWAEDDNFHAYVRQVEARVLTFEVNGEQLTDLETGSVWEIGRGMAIEGPLLGQALQAVPSSSAFDWAWRDFYPDSEFFSPQ